MTNIKAVTTKDQWQRVLGLAQNPQYVHSWFWGQLQISLGRNVLRYEIVEDGQTVGFFVLVIYPFTLGKSMGYTPYGPVSVSPQPAQLQAVKTFLQQLCRQHKLAFVRTEQAFGLKTPTFAYRTAWAQPRGQMVLDISQAEATLLSTMSKNTRRNIKKSLDQGLQVKFYTGQDILKIKQDFIDLNHSNISSHQTTTHTDQYFDIFLQALAQTPNSFAVLASDPDGQTLAINIYYVDDTYAFCPYGASSPAGKKLGAYYFIKWHSIQKLQAIGVQTFDWGGIAVGKADDNLQGLNQFKLGFGGQQIVHGDFYDVVAHWPLYVLYLVRKLIRSR